MSFNEAAEYAKDLEVGGKKGFRVPSQHELDVLFQNRDAGSLKGTFDLADSYWSSSLPDSADYKYFSSSACAQRFGNGIHDYELKARRHSVRCVRN